MWVVDGLNQQTVSTFKLLNDSLGQVRETNLRVLVVNVFGELRDALGVGLGLELEALGRQQGLQLLIVCDDAIVDDAKLPIGIRSVAGLKLSVETHP